MYMVYFLILKHLFGLLDPIWRAFCSALAITPTTSHTLVNFVRNISQN